MSIPGAGLAKQAVGKVAEYAINKVTGGGGGDTKTTSAPTEETQNPNTQSYTAYATGQHKTYLSGRGYR